VISNLDTYLAIAKDALAASLAAEASHRKPKPDGSPGFIISLDRTKTSFRQGLIAIVFAGVYLDALLHVVGTQRLGRRQYKKIHKDKYEEKLNKLGVTDKDTIVACERFRKARNDVTHEKATQPLTVKNLRIAQREAEHALHFIDTVTRLLCVVP